MSPGSPVASLNVESSEFEAFPEYGGSHCILHRSPDRTRLAGSFKESGSHELTMPYDEFVYVVAGGVSITVEDCEKQDFGVGDAFYITQGEKVRWEMTDDFQDVTVLISDQAIDI
jgi:uncharacterized cupin superfamily protein